MRTFLMLVALAAVTGAGTACFGLFTDDDRPAAVEESCEGLVGQARIDCEQRTATERR